MLSVGVVMAMTPDTDMISRAEADRQTQEAVAAALMEAAALAESAMRCRSCGGVFAVKNPHTDETCPKGRADWDNAEPDEVADAILALIPADALAARIEELEAALAKAVEALHQIAGDKDFADDPWGIARTTLAELTGVSHE